MPGTQHLPAIFASACIIGAAGCVEQTLTIDSNPPGALVTANDQEIGRTPVTRDFTYYGNYDLQIRHDGYETLNTNQHVDAPAWNWPPLDLFASLMPVWFKDQHKYTYTLKPASTQPVDAREIEARAIRFQGLMESSPYTHAPTTRSATRPTSKPAETD